MADDQGAGADQAADQGVVSGIHGVLHGVGQNQQQHQVERCVLPGLASPRQAQKHQQKQIDGDAANHKFPPRNGHSPHRTSLVQWLLCTLAAVQGKPYELLEWADNVLLQTMPVGADTEVP